MEDASVAAQPNPPATHNTTSQQPALSKDAKDVERSNFDDEDDERGAFDYYTSTPAVAAVAALGNPKGVSEAEHLNDVAYDGSFMVDCDTVSSSDSPRSDGIQILDDANEYEPEARRTTSSRYKTMEDVYNAKTRANNDQQYDERFSVHSEDEDDDNLVNVHVHERLINRETDGMECINQAKTMMIQQPLNASSSSQNYGSTGMHSHPLSFCDLNRAPDNATGFSRDLMAASGTLPANQARVEKSTYSNRRSPPFGDPVSHDEVMHSALQLLSQGHVHSLEEPPSHKTDDVITAEGAAAKKKRKKKKHSKGKISCLPPTTLGHLLLCVIVLLCLVI